jgi:hypothetical protein
MTESNLHIITLPCAGTSWHAKVGTDLMNLQGRISLLPISLVQMVSA